MTTKKLCLIFLPTSVTIYNCVSISVRVRIEPEGVQENIIYRSLYINNSLHFARKYARIFVRGHYLFREAKKL